MNEDDALRRHATIVRGLCRAAAYPHPAGVIEVIETHLSTVILAGEFAYKLKKPVALGFADFSTLERRQHFCEEELRINRRGAPGLYLDVQPIVGTPRDPHLGPGPGRTIEFAVRMRRFAPRNCLDHLARDGKLDAAQVERLAVNIAAYHAQAAPVPADSAFGTAKSIWRWADDNLDTLERATLAGAEARRVRDLRAWTNGEFARRCAVFAQRRHAGRVRECHGDLHLGNIVLLAGVPVPFDAIEFNDELRHIDVFSDVAFVFMDLARHDRPDLAWRLLNRYLAESGDYAGLATLRFYAVYRALVRAKIALIRLGQGDAPEHELALAADALSRYIWVAGELARAPAPAVILMHGVTGSGKSTVAGILSEEFGAATLRSDCERKRLYNVDARDHSATARGLSHGLYGPVATERTYDRLRDLAASVLAADVPVIVDASFLRRGDRDALRSLAGRMGARCFVVECSAPVKVLEERVVRRLVDGADPSDANLQVLAFQVRHREALSQEERRTAFHVDTDAEPAALAARCRRLAGRIHNECDEGQPAPC